MSSVITAKRDAERLGEPAAYQTACEAVDHATSRIIVTQAGLIARLTEEVRELRRELGK